MEVCSNVAYGKHSLGLNVPAVALSGSTVALASVLFFTLKKQKWPNCSILTTEMLNFHIGGSFISIIPVITFIESSNTLVEEDWIVNNTLALQPESDWL